MCIRSDQQLYKISYERNRGGKLYKFKKIYLLQHIFRCRMSRLAKAGPVSRQRQQPSHEPIQRGSFLAETRRVHTHSVIA